MTCVFVVLRQLERSRVSIGWRRESTWLAQGGGGGSADEEDQASHAGGLGCGEEQPRGSVYGGPLQPQHGAIALLLVSFFLFFFLFFLLASFRFCLILSYFLAFFLVCYHLLLSFCFLFC